MEAVAGGWGSVVAIEAQERIYYALAGNIAINNCFNAICMNAAVSSATGTMRVPVPDYLTASSFGSLELQQRDGNEFIGPRSQHIRVMGDKSTARDTMKAAGVPTVPGSDGLIADEAEGIEVARQVGFPVMIKATAGGGGRGMRLAMTEAEFLPLLQQAQQ